MKKLVKVSLFLVLISCGRNKPEKDNYEILKEETVANICRMQVKLYEKITETELENIAVELRGNRESYDKLWLAFYLPELLPGKSGDGAWAVASFTPKLEVHILGEKKITAGEKKEEVVFPKYSNVIDMLEEANDYTGEQLEDISKNKDETHIRVSSEFYNIEKNEIIKEQVKRDIVYAAFQTFAMTDLDKITITSIPIIRTSFNPNLEYDGKPKEALKQTVTITREKAKEILNKYLKISSFHDLYQLDSTLYLPNAKFERLMLGELDNVFLDLK